MIPDQTGANHQLRSGPRCFEERARVENSVILATHANWHCGRRNQRNRRARLPYWSLGYDRSRVSSGRQDFRYRLHDDGWSALVTELKPAIKFGTDGWRALIAREFTFANLERVTQAYADFLQSERGAAPFVIVDITGPSYLNALRMRRRGEAGNGFRVAVFFRRLSHAADFVGSQGPPSEWRIVITASHNPATSTVSRLKHPGRGAPRPKPPRMWKSWSTHSAKAIQGAG